MNEERESITIKKGYEVWLHLPGKDVPGKDGYKIDRHIGDLVGWDPKAGTAREFRAWRKTKDVYHEVEGIGICYRLIEDINFDIVTVYLSGRTLQTTRRHLRASGQFRHFKKKGLEPQMFLPLSEFGLDKARETEKRLDAEEGERKRKRSERVDLFKTVAGQPCPDVPAIPGTRRTAARTQTAMSRIAKRNGHEVV